MAVPKKGPLTPENVKEVAHSLREDKARRREAVEHMRRDFHGFVESTFELTPEQRKEMHSQMPKPAADAVAHACIVALETGGEVDFEIVRGQPEPDLRVELYCQGGDGDVECGVRISWEK